MSGMNGVFAKRRARLLAMKAIRDNHIPGDKAITCPKCGQDSDRKSVAQNLSVCPKCGYHFPIGAYYRLSTILDPGSFRELFEKLSRRRPPLLPRLSGKGAGRPAQDRPARRPRSPPPAPSAATNVWWGCWTAASSWAP